MAGAERLAAGVHGADLGEGEGLTGAASEAGGTGVLRGERERERAGERREEGPVEPSPPWFGCNSIPCPGLAASPAKLSIPKPTEGNCSKRIAAALQLLGLKLLPMRLKRVRGMSVSFSY